MPKTKFGLSRGTLALLVPICRFQSQNEPPLQMAAYIGLMCFAYITIHYIIHLFYIQCRDSQCSISNILMLQIILSKVTIAKNDCIFLAVLKTFEASGAPTFETRTIWISTLNVE